MPETNTLKKIANWAGKFLSNGAHAQQDIPSQHRLLNASGMFAGWFALDKLRDVIFAVDQKSEGEFVEIKREEIAAPLRFLHKAIDWDPYSDAPEHQWKKLLHQMTPAVGGAIGAIAGSMYAFERNGRAQHFKELKGMQKLAMLDAEYVAQYAQSFPLRALAGAFATFSAASGLTFFYGLFLNSAFASSNGAKIFAGDLAKGNLGPVKALDSLLSNISVYAKDAAKKHTDMSDEWATQFVTRVLEPFFGHELKTPEAQKKAVATLQGMVNEAYHNYEKSGLKPEEIAKKVQEDMGRLFSKGQFESTLQSKFHLNPKTATLGNANPLIRKMFGKDTHAVPAQAGNEGAVFAGAAVLGGTGALALGKHADVTPSTNEDTGHTQPLTQGKSPKDYVESALAMHQQKHNGFAPPPVLKWIGDAELAVLPKNRMLSALGLTAGQIIGGNMGSIATGYTITGKAIEKAKVPTYLQWLHKIVPDYHAGGLRPRDKWINIAHIAVFSLGGLLGVKLGSDFAYSNVPKKLENPKYLEDFLPRVSMHQGQGWGWLSAMGAMWGSSSGVFYMPVPGVNYGLSLAGRTVSMQDRNIMLPMESLSGATMPSYLRLREGLNYLCYHSIGNKEKDPVGVYEALTYTILGPIFRDTLTADHIKQFVDTMHKVRDQFMEEDGIPKHKRKEALAAMKKQFTGEGLEVLLINMGLNPGEIVFDQLNGMVGKIGNALGGETKVSKEQENYAQELIQRLAKYAEEGKISDEKAKKAIEQTQDTIHIKHNLVMPSDQDTTDKFAAMAIERIENKRGKTIKAPRPASDFVSQVNRLEKDAGVGAFSLGA